ncbi:hypothetical protein CVT25_015151, partial [Psilocybe cyanescens]
MTTSGKPKKASDAYQNVRPDDQQPLTTTRSICIAQSFSSAARDCATISTHRLQGFFISSVHLTTSPSRSETNDTASIVSVVSWEKIHSTGTPNPITETFAMKSKVSIRRRFRRISHGNDGDARAIKKIIDQGKDPVCLAEGIVRINQETLLLTNNDLGVIMVQFRTEECTLLRVEGIEKLFCAILACSSDHSLPTQIDAFETVQEEAHMLVIERADSTKALGDRLGPYELIQLQCKMFYLDLGDCTPLPQHPDGHGFNEAFQCFILGVRQVAKMLVVWHSGEEETALVKAFIPRFRLQHVIEKIGNNWSIRRIGMGVEGFKYHGRRHLTTVFEGDISLLTG